MKIPEKIKKTTFEFVTLATS